MDALLTKFNEDRSLQDEDTPQPRKRLRIGDDGLRNESNPFQLCYKDRNYASQYYHMYQYRLKTFRERVLEECDKRWDAGFTLNGKLVLKKNKVLDIQGHQPCWCIGSIYCEMKYKPNVLDEVINDTYGAPDLAKSYTDKEGGSDEIMLEDESGRVLLVGDFIRSAPFITGVVVGILGMEADAGTFQVLDICYPTPLLQNPLPTPSATPQPRGQIALVSGLNLNNASPDRLLKLEILREFLMGGISGKIDEISQIGRLLICGNSVDFDINSVSKDELVNSLTEFSKFLHNILPSISVDVMPGTNDPSDKSLPQQPFHKSLFDESLESFFHGSNKEILNLVTNPYEFCYNGVDVLAISGKNINDICKYVIPSNEKVDNDSENKVAQDQNSDDFKDDIEHRLDLMECTMKWQNIAPTAPDTLWCYPYTEKDPFVLQKWPHVYVVGNQPNFGTRLMKIGDKSIRIISVPEFSSTGVVVLLNLETLEVETVKIDI
ncbi:hys2p [Saccharomyces arboricola H-6]|uniref:DNA-directed DNA polymerase n=1 Tax=Saccharomyces arboricola (strain H-6 / AS 2.3317 / CBS 10644) TaxID=1160507 RepID=J8Q063_SACAR|nr:hys2p [Saccharomyces arboricola H-6]